MKSEKITLALQSLYNMLYYWIKNTKLSLRVGFMLVRFNVKNFLSFSDRVDPFNDNSRISHEFSMIAGNVRNKEEHLLKIKNQKVLKFAAIYGANAAGKSNIIKAIQVFRQFVLNGTTPVGVANMYCMTQPENRERSSYFEAEFIVDDELYAYGFEVILSEGNIISEWLYRLNQNSAKMLYEKKSENDEYELGAELKDIEDLRVLLKSFSGSNGLFLSFVNKNMAGFYRANKQALVLQRVFSWFVNVLSVNFPDFPLQDASFLLDNASLREVSELLKAFGTGITDVVSEKIDFQKVLPFINRNVLNEAFEKRDEVVNLMKSGQLPKGKVQINMIVKTMNSFYIVNFGQDDESIQSSELKFKHSFQGDAKLPFSFESDGTQRLFDLLEILLGKSDKVYVLDELDRRLHPCLTYEFVKTFFHYAQKRNIQLIVSSHEARLLDFNLLRRDEIWFVEKNKEGESCIFSLEEYNERFDRKIDKAYLEGRYGGVPIFTSLFPVR